MPKNIHVQRQEAIRHWLAKRKLSGFLVPRSDEFLGEYVPENAERLRWLTGFTGSWGTAIITRSKAALIVDGRYTIQAGQQTKGQDVELVAPGDAGTKRFLEKTLGKKQCLGFDPWLFSIAETRKWEKLASSLGIRLEAVSENPVDALWLDRPPIVKNPVVAHPLRHAGLSASDKLKSIAEHVKSQNCDAVVLSDPHSVAWALNLRGSDISHTPVALLRAIVRANGKAFLFVDKSRLNSEAARSLSDLVTLLPPQQFAIELTKHSKSKPSRVMLDPSNCPEAIRSMLVQGKSEVVEAADPCLFPRARKNTIEQRGARLAHIRDGAALTNFLRWMDVESPTGNLTEKSAQDKLKDFRIATGKLVDLSFGSISAAGPNAALPHYHVGEGKGRRIRTGEIYLIDSGGQYKDGTTDVTRTIIIGTPTPEMQRHFTLVLKGMIAVSIACFPEGTTGAQIDALARAALWQQGFDFDHGTGHGVGSFLSVHEGPARISKAGNTALEPGMIVSNEPGYYAPGKYGIRIENLLLVRPPQTPKGGNRKMLSFETLTFAPIDKRLIREDLLTKPEIQWLDSYHHAVWTKIGKRIEPDVKSWLRESCTPLSRKT